MPDELPSGTVTLLFTDIEGSTRLLDTVGPLYGDLLAQHHRTLREVWTHHAGVEVDTEGDAFFVAFPSAAEGVAAAVEAQHRLEEQTWPDGQAVRVRMGVHTGAPKVQDGKYWGSDIHYAARLAGAAHGGQVLASAATRGLLPPGEQERLESLGEHTLKDFPAPREVFHVVVGGVGASSFPPPRTLDRRRNNLPVPAADLLGRESEVEDLVARCAGEQRLVTITGPGGTGKTRLAVEVGHRLAGALESVCFVPLEACTTAAELWSAVGLALSLPEVVGIGARERVEQHLRPHQVLLVLDNAEHLLDAAVDVAALAGAGERVRVLVTSQAALRVAGEHVVRLGPLAVPEGAGRDLAALAVVPAVALLLQRVRAAGSAFALTPKNAADVVRLCEQLEGMPLALELAAARLDLMDVATLCGRLERGLDALGKGGRDLPARQRGLVAVLEWTVGLLGDSERRLLRQLSVIPGGFDVALVEAAFGDALDDLEALVDVGLVRSAHSGRLALRPPVRRYAAQVLSSPEQDQQAFACVATALAELAEPFERRWLLKASDGSSVLGPETANLLAALDWARDVDPGLHARLAASTGWWMTHSNLSLSARTHVALALGRTQEPTLRARLLQAQGALSLASADPKASLLAADAWRELGDAEGEVISLVYGGSLYCHAGDAAAALQLATRTEQVAERTGDAGLIWMARTATALGLLSVGRLQEADVIARQLESEVELDGGWVDFWITTLLADIALADGRFKEAVWRYGRCMAAMATYGSVVGEIVQANTIALALVQLRRKDEAAFVVAVCDLAHAELSWSPPSGLQAPLEQARQGIPADRLAAAVREAGELGVRAGLDQVGELARGARPGHGP